MKEVPGVKVYPMPKNKRMRELIENLANLESSDYDRLSSDGRHYLGKIWNLLGMQSQEQISGNKTVRSKK